MNLILHFCIRLSNQPLYRNQQEIQRWQILPQLIAQTLCPFHDYRLFHLRETQSLLIFSLIDLETNRKLLDIISSASCAEFTNSGNLTLFSISERESVLCASANNESFCLYLFILDFE